MAGGASDHRVSPACTKSCRFASPLVARRSTRVQLTSAIYTSHARVSSLLLNFLMEPWLYLNGFTISSRRSQSARRTCFAKTSQETCSVFLRWRRELLQIVVRVTDSRANPLVWLIRSKMQHQWRAAMSILARVPVTLESQCVAEERRIRDRLEESVIETDVGQDEQVARIVVVLPSRVVPHVKVKKVANPVS